MAPVGKVACLFVRPGLPGQLGDEVPRNEVANLLKNREFRAGWSFFVFHTRRVAVNEKSIQPFFYLSVGWLCFKTLIPGD